MQPQEKYPLNEKLTLKEYLQLEQDNDQKYEYYDGYAYAMAGGSFNHNIINTNITTDINIALRGKECTAMNSDTKLYIDSSNSYVYPDLMVACGDLEAAENHTDALTNPVIIIEVLSKSTEANDRGDKFKLYRTVSTLRYYVLIKQDKVQVEIYHRKSSTSLWSIQTIEGINKSLELILSDTETLLIPLKNIYDKVKFEK